MGRGKNSKSTIHPIGIASIAPCSSQRAKWIEADRLWRLAYASETPPLLPGAPQILRMLSRKFRLGIVTSGSRARVRKQLRSFELAQYFSACVCAEDASHRKPHPAPIQLAMKRMRAAPEETIYVGDSAEDIEMARRAGVRPIGVLGPFPTAKRMRAAEPELLLRSIIEFASLFASAGEKAKWAQPFLKAVWLDANSARC